MFGTWDTEWVDFQMDTVHEKSTSEFQPSEKLKRIFQKIARNKPQKKSVSTIYHKDI